MKKLTLLLLSLSFSSIMLAGTYSGGNGDQNDPYKIATTADLIELGNTSADWGAYFIQTANIAFNADETLVDWDGDGSAGPAEGFSPIGDGTTNFTGNYDGDGYTIDELFIDRSGVVLNGLFGFIGSDGEVKYLGVTNVELTGQNQMGGLAGRNNGLIENSFTTGVVSGRERTGGLVGHNEGTGTIKNSYSGAEVISDHEKIGGLVGDNSNATIKKCYSFGLVDDAGAGSSVGGLTGREDGGGATNEDSFWDEETSGQTSSGGGTGKTTSEMQDVATFTDETNTTGLTSAWDFANNPHDDTNNEDYWDISSSINDGYPHLIDDSGDPLPVNLLSFTGERKAESMVELNWSTASEQNNDRFEIQRSHKGNSFATVGVVNGAGNSNEVVKYQFTDSNAPEGTVYYRLKQVDYNGAYEYSDIIAIRDKDKKQEGSLNIYPNPVSGEFNLQLPEYEGTMQVDVYDMTGRRVFQKAISERQSLIIQSSAWPEGVYMVIGKNRNMLLQQRIIVL